MGQYSLNASHDVFMVRTMLFDPSSYWSEVHSFSGDLDHERTCRENLALRSTSERMGQSFDRGGSQRSTMLSAKCSRRILIGHRDMTSSPPASGCTEGTSWRFTWCNDPSGVACGQP